MAYCYVNGKIVSEKNALLSVRDVGILRGYAVFDVIRTYGKTPFLVHEHFARLERSAAALGLRVPFSEEKFTRIVRELCEKNACKNVMIRTVITGGATKDGMHFKRNAQSTFIITAPLSAFAKDVYEKGVVLETLEHKRELAHAKTTNYIAAVIWHNTPRIKPVFDALYVWKGKALEATTSNFFIVKGATIITPKSNVLHGITRNTVIGFARKTARVIERDISVRELKTADEAFLTATNKEIVPVVMVDGKKIGSGKPGKRTKMLIKEFHDMVMKSNARVGTQKSERTPGLI